MKGKLFALLLSFVMILSSLPANIVLAASQEAVSKDGKIYVDVVTTAKGIEKGDSVSGNNKSYQIKIDGDVVGQFVFTKNGDYIVMEVLKDVEFVVEWNCSSKYASCDLSGAGVYKLPRLLQDNGKTQSFSKIWIQPANYITKEPEVQEPEVKDLEMNVYDNGDYFRIYPVDWDISSIDAVNQSGENIPLVENRSGKKNDETIIFGYNKYTEGIGFSDK